MRLIDALIAIALIGLAAPAGAQLSPGPLAAAHQELEGTASCFKCHARGGAASMDERCLACHTEVAWTIEHGRGLHGRSARKDCASCHPDHAGRDLELIRWDEGAQEKFDHGRAGWALAGKHATLACRACHKLELERSPAATLLRRKDHGKSWLGLETDCASCHADPHRAELGPDCARCHDARAWKPAPSFDHAKSAFPLTGKHAATECAKCHMVEGAAHYQPIAHADCSACHRDPHAGRFGPGCASCHSTGGFRVIRADAFDHDRTRYPLRGRHVAVACATCHDPERAWGPKPPFASCSSCHRDPHAGQATLAGKPADCAACHRVEGYRPSIFTVEQHRRTTYPLDGKHAGVECAGCHKQAAPSAAATLGPARVALRPPHARCAVCHADAHGGQLRARADGGACEACHGTTSFKPSTFTAREHAGLRLALAGRHAEIACAACHGGARAGLPPPAPAQELGPARFAFALVEVECASCHADPHAGRFAAGGPRARLDGCRDCHGLDAFHPSTMGIAAHDASGFKLEGAHRAVACQLCHRELDPAPPASSLRLAAGHARPLPFDAAPLTCAGCHATPHGDQFAARRDGGACEACHGLEAFAPASRFDHERDAAFRLEGAHARTPCASCHRSVRDAAGKAQVVYRPVASRCESCHTGKAIQGARP